MSQVDFKKMSVIRQLPGKNCLYFTERIGYEDLALAETERLTFSENGRLACSNKVLNSFS